MELFMHFDVPLALELWQGEEGFMVLARLDSLPSMLEAEALAFSLHIMIVHGLEQVRSTLIPADLFALSAEKHKDGSFGAGVWIGPFEQAADAGMALAMVETVLGPHLAASAEELEIGKLTTALEAAAKALHVAGVDHGCLEASHAAGRAFVIAAASRAAWK
jgi:hypothetical protein